MLELVLRKLGRAVFPMWGPAAQDRERLGRIWKNDLAQEAPRRHPFATAIRHVQEVSVPVGLHGDDVQIYEREKARASTLLARSGQSNLRVAIVVWLPFMLARTRMNPGPCV